MQWKTEGNRKPVKKEQKTPQKTTTKPEEANGNTRQKASVFGSDETVPKSGRYTQLLQWLHRWSVRHSNIHKHNKHPTITETGKRY